MGEELVAALQQQDLRLQALISASGLVDWGTGVGPTVGAGLLV